MPRFYLTSVNVSALPVSRACSCTSRMDANVRWRRREVGRRRMKLKLNSPHERVCLNSCRTEYSRRTGYRSTRRARTRSKSPSWTWTSSPVTARESVSMWARSFTFTFIKAYLRLFFLLYMSDTDTCTRIGFDSCLQLKLHGNPKHMLNWSRVMHALITWETCCIIM